MSENIFRDGLDNLNKFLNKDKDRSYEKTPNENIKCSVQNCSHQCDGHCGLKCVKISSHEKRPEDGSQVDCTDFQEKKN